MKQLLLTTVLLFTINLFGNCAHFTSDSQDHTEVKTTNASSNLFNKWLEAFNSLNLEEYTLFIKKYAPSRINVIEDDFAFASDVGGFEFIKIKELGQTMIKVLANERRLRNFAEITLDIDPDNFEHIHSIDFKMIPKPKDLVFHRLSEAETIKETQTETKRLEKLDLFSGVILLAKKDEILYHQAFGYSDRDKRIRNIPETIFRIGSMSKMLTAVATLQLVQDGKVHLKAPISTYLKDLDTWGDLPSNLQKPS